VSCLATAMFMSFPGRYRTRTGDAGPLFDNGVQRVMTALKRGFNSGEAVTFSVADSPEKNGQPNNSGGRFLENLWCFAPAIEGLIALNASTK
jgi:hypothetical protein